MSLCLLSGVWRIPSGRPNDAKAAPAVHFLGRQSGCQALGECYHLKPAILFSTGKWIFGNLNQEQTKDQWLSISFNLFQMSFTFHKHRVFPSFSSGMPDAKATNPQLRANRTAPLLGERQCTWDLLTITVIIVIWLTLFYNYIYY